MDNRDYAPSAVTRLLAPALALALAAYFLTDSPAGAIPAEAPTIEVRAPANTPDASTVGTMPAQQRVTAQQHRP